MGGGTAGGSTGSSSSKGGSAKGNEFPWFWALIQVMALGSLIIYFFSRAEKSKQYASQVYKTS
jgi:hypothetical protein